MYAVFLGLTLVMLAHVGARRLHVRQRRYHRRPEDLRIAIIGAG
ncbi:hypothetical protein [Leekyejoonella antrihumi]|nr:hypothetical protein [Leekyejoonella antrihumi]